MKYGRTILYRRHTFIQTEITTDDVTRVAFGRRYQTTARLWEIQGRHGKDAGCRPFITSARAAREYVREQYLLNGK